MSEDAWHARWRDGRIGFHQPTANHKLIREWPALGVPRDASVFVPLCGKALDLAWLAERGHRVFGVELSEVAVRSFFDEQELTPEISDEAEFRVFRHERITLFCGDYYDLSPRHLGPVDAVYDRASLVALPAAERPRYASHLRRLAGRAPVLLVALEYREEEMDGPPFPVWESEVRTLFEGQWRCELVSREDVLAGQERFRQKGLSALGEVVYRLSAHAGSGTGSEE